MIDYGSWVYLESNKLPRLFLKPGRNSVGPQIQDGRHTQYLDSNLPTILLYLYLYVTWQYALLCYRSTGAIAPHCGFSGVSADGNCTYTSIKVPLRLALVQSDEPSDLRGSLSPTRAGALV